MLSSSNPNEVFTAPGPVQLEQAALYHLHQLIELGAFRRCSTDLFYFIYISIDLSVIYIIYQSLAERAELHQKPAKSARPCPDKLLV